MTFLSTIFIKIFLILFVASYIAIAGPVPDVAGNDLSVERREQASGGSVSSYKQAAGGDSPLLGGDFLGPSGDDGHGGKDADLKKQASHNKGVGGSSLAGTRHKQGNTAGQSAGPFSAFGEPPRGGSEQGGSVSGGGGDFLSILSGNGGAGGEKDGISILDILRKRNL